MKRSIVLISIFLCRVMLFADDFNLEIKSSISNLSPSIIRMIVSLKNIRAFVVLKNGEPKKAGIECPVFMAGNATKRGLLRYISNPLIYMPGSSVFNEKTCFTLETSTDLSRSMAFTFSPIPTFLTLFMLLENENEANAGVHLFLPLANNIYMETLLINASPEHEYTKDKWFEINGLYPGGALNNLSFRLFVTTKDFNTSFLAGMSFGYLISPGYFLSPVFTYKSDMLSIALALAFKSNEYRNSKGKKLTDCLSAGIKSSFAPWSWLALKITYQKVHDETSIAYNFFQYGKDYFSSILKIQFELIKKTFLIGNINFEAHSEKNIEEHIITRQLSFSCGLDIDMIYNIMAVLSIKNMIDVNQVSFTLENELIVDYFHLAIKGKIRFDDEQPFVRYSVKGMLKLTRLEFFIELASDQEIELGTDWRQLIVQEIFCHCCLTIGFECSL